MALEKKKKYVVYPGLISGEKSLEKITEELHKLGSSRPFVLSGKNYKTSGLIKKLKKNFSASGITHGEIFLKTGNTATLEEIKMLAQKFRVNNCDSIIAAGSSSIMDIARGVNIIASTGSEKIIQFSGKGKIPCRLKPFVSIPLPVLTGNETSNTALIDGVKYSSDYLYPDIIITDPKLSALAPKNSILESALSILTVSIDSALAPKGNPERNVHLYKAINLICKNLEKMHVNPGNKKIKSDLVDAGAITGMACDSAPGFIYCAALALSRETSLTFGTAAGIIMHHAIEYAYENHGSHDSGILLAIAGEKIFAITPEKQRGEVAAAMLESWIYGHGSSIPKNLNKIKFPDYRIQPMSDNAEHLSSGTYKSQDFFSVFTRSLTGKIVIKEKRKISFDLDKIVDSSFK